MKSFLLILFVVFHTNFQPTAQKCAGNRYCSQEFYGLQLVKLSKTDIAPSADYFQVYSTFMVTRPCRKMPIEFDGNELKISAKDETITYTKIDECRFKYNDTDSEKELIYGVIYNANNELCFAESDNGADITYAACYSNMNKPSPHLQAFREKISMVVKLLDQCP